MDQVAGKVGDAALQLIAQYCQAGCTSVLEAFHAMRRFRLGRTHLLRPRPLLVQVLAVTSSKQRCHPSSSTCW
jgi:hypothetical protein